MTLKILGGHLKNRLLKSPPETLARPTTSILRKAVFDICQGVIEGAHVLDLFACTGAMGIEAMSRGAACVTFVEKNTQLTHLLRENLVTLDLLDKALIVAKDVFKAVPSLIEKNKPYTIVYIDPPYPLMQKDKHLFIDLIHTLENESLLADGAKVFIEEGSPGVFPITSMAFNQLVYKNTRRFSSALLHQFTIPL